MLQNKRILIVGIANKMSIATGIARAMHGFGAELAFTYQNDKLKGRVEDVAAQCGSSSDLCWRCDVEDDSQIEAVCAQIQQRWARLDGIVHSVAFAPQDQLSGDFTDSTSRAGFNKAHEVSSYSFIALAKAARPLLSADAALVTLTYLGAQRTMPNYNVMGLAKASLEAATRYLAASLGKDGIRVNAISAGPIKTLASAGIRDIRAMLAYNAERTYLKRNITTEEVGNTAAFLCSNLASGITGEVLYVDAGFNVSAMEV